MCVFFLVVAVNKTNAVRKIQLDCCQTLFECSFSLFAIVRVYFFFLFYFIFHSFSFPLSRAHNYKQTHTHIHNVFVCDTIVVCTAYNFELVSSCFHDEDSSRQKFHWLSVMVQYLSSTNNVVHLPV